MKVLAITQARYGSTRLPAKILREVDGKTLLEIHLGRILQARSLAGLKIATTDEEGSRYITAVAEKLGIPFHKGSVEDVLSRFYDTAAPERPDWVVRLTSDCPLIDPSVIDELVHFALEHEYDYVRTDPASFPDGLDTEVMRFRGGTLFKTFYYPNREGIFPASDYRITLDEPEDFQVLEALIHRLGTGRHWKEYIDYLQEHPQIKSVNSRFGYNEGYDKSLQNDKTIR